VRVVFLGNDVWSVPALVALDAARPTLDLVAIVTRPPRPGRRGAGPAPTPVAEAARRFGLPMLETPTVRTGESLERLRSTSPDVLAVVAYGELLTTEVLSTARLGGVNLHFSLLPRWRGASPVQHAILAGDERTGATTMLIDEGLDTGPLLDTVEEPILPEDDAGSLGDRLSSIGADLLVSSIGRLADGRIQPRPQRGAATLAPKLGAEDRRLVWSETAAALVRRVRAFAPEPGASTSFRGRAIKILRARDVGAGGEPGSIVTVDDEGFVVAAREGGVRPLLLVPAGRTPMSAADFARGAKPRVGERLG